MRSTIAWSYDLLGAEERQLFRWLGVFIGDATVDALGAVAGLTNEGLSAGLAALVDASLLQWMDARGTRRYTQLVTLRAYAEERLRACGEWDEARRRHARYFLELAELSFSATRDQVEEVTARVEADYENLRAALSWAWETGATMHGLRMVGALRRFWDSRSYFLEGLDWLERFIARAGAPQNREEQTALAEAWTGVVVMSHRLDRFEQCAGRRREGSRAATRAGRQNRYRLGLEQPSQSNRPSCATTSGHRCCTKRLSRSIARHRIVRARSFPC